MEVCPRLANVGPNPERLDSSTPASRRIHLFDDPLGLQPIRALDLDSIKGADVALRSTKADIARAWDGRHEPPEPGTWERMTSRSACRDPAVHNPHSHIS